MTNVLAVASKNISFEVPEYASYSSNSRIAFREAIGVKFDPLMVRGKPIHLNDFRDLVQVGRDVEFLANDAI